MSVCERKRLRLRQRESVLFVDPGGGDLRLCGQHGGQHVRLSLVIAVGPARARAHTRSQRARERARGRESAHPTPREILFGFLSALNAWTTTRTVSLSPLCPLLSACLFLSLVPLRPSAPLSYLIEAQNGVGWAHRHIRHPCTRSSGSAPHTSHRRTQHTQRARERRRGNTQLESALVALSTARGVRETRSAIIPSLCRSLRRWHPLLPPPFPPPCPPLRPLAPSPSFWCALDSDGDGEATASAGCIGKQYHFMRTQAPGYFYFNILRGLYWKTVPFRSWISPVIATRRSPAVVFASSIEFSLGNR